MEYRIPQQLPNYHTFLMNTSVKFDSCRVSKLSMSSQVAKGTNIRSSDVL